MKNLLTLTVMSLALATPVLAEGDAAKGKTGFNKCKACHAVVGPDGDVIAKGGRTGPNLYGVIGRQAGTGDFRYSKTMIAAGEAGLIWDEILLAEFSADPRGFLKSQGTDGKTKMTFKLRKGGADVAAYLASVGPAPVEADMTEETGVADDGAEISTDADTSTETSTN